MAFQMAVSQQLLANFKSDFPLLALVDHYTLTASINYFVSI